MNATANKQPRRALMPGRIVALVLVGLAVAGLAYLRFAPDAGPVSVPAGAAAGDLALDPCEYATEAGSYAADCGTLVVPENRADPGSRLIALPVTRVRALADEGKEPVFRLEGGPGITNMEFANASRFAGDRDVVLVGYRGVDGSSRLDCPEVESALARSTDLLGEKSFSAVGDAFANCAERLTGDGVDLAGYGLPQQVEDFEAARIALGYDRIDLVSESAGTRTALIYAWRHPESIHRSVLLGANPPGHFLWDPQTTDDQIGRYARLCADDESCAARTDDLAATLDDTAARMPDDWFLLPIDESNVRVFSFYGLMESTAEAAPLSAPLTLDAWLSASEGDPSGLWLQSVAGDLVQMPFVWGQYAAAGALDAEAAREYFAANRGAEDSLGWAGSAFAWAGGRLADAWPTTPEASAYRRMRTSDVETLVVGGALDTTTPPQVARRELMPYLPNGHQVVLPGFGHTLTFWQEQREAGTRLVSAFLDTGAVDDSLYEPQNVDFTPSFGQPAMAKVVLGSMVGLAALTLLSLAWILLRVRWRGPFGPKASAVLRWVWAPVLGLGGWIVVVLVVLRAFPGVPLADELVAVLSVGATVGLTLYLAWVDAGWSARTKAAGFAGALGGAFLGGWLGVGATGDALAVLAAIVGAVAGANLALVLLDIAWDRRAHDRFAEESVETLEARPSVG